jgi:hypothetical protein
MSLDNTTLRALEQVLMSVATSSVCLVAIPSFTLSRLYDFVRKLVTMELLILCLSKHCFVLNTQTSDCCAL